MSGEIINIQLREKNRYDYIYVDTRDNSVHLLVPFMSGDTIGLDNTCKALSEIYKFFGLTEQSAKSSALEVVNRYIEDLELDIDFLSRQSLLADDENSNLERVQSKNHRLSQLKEYRYFLKFLSSEAGRIYLQTKDLTTGQYPLLIKNFFSKHDNFFSIQLAPKKEDIFTKFPFPLFSAERGNVDPSSASLGKVFRSIFKNIKIQKKSEENIRKEIIEAALTALSIKLGDTFNFKENFELFRTALAGVLQVRFPKLTNANLQQTVVGESYGYEDLVSLYGACEGNPKEQSYAQMCTWGECILAASLPPGTLLSADKKEEKKETKNDFSKHVSELKVNLGSTSVDVRLAAEEKLSIITQFFLAHANVYCRLKGWVPENTNWGSLLEKTMVGEGNAKRSLATIFAEQVKNAIEKDQDIEATLFNLINQYYKELKLISPLSRNSKEKIQTIFRDNYNTIADSPHFDEFILCFPEEEGAAISYNSKMSVDFYHFMKDEKLNYKPSRSFGDNEVVIPPLSFVGSSRRLLPYKLDDQQRVAVNTEAVSKIINTGAITSMANWKQFLCSKVNEGNHYIFEEIAEELKSFFKEKEQDFLSLKKLVLDSQDNELIRAFRKVFAIKQSLELDRIVCRELWHKMFLECRNEEQKARLLSLEDFTDDESYINFLRLYFEGKDIKINLEKEGTYKIGGTDDEIINKTREFVSGYVGKGVYISPSLAKDLRCVAAALEGVDFFSFRTRTFLPIIDTLNSLHIATGGVTECPGEVTEARAIGKTRSEVLEIEKYRGCAQRGICLRGYDIVSSLLNVPPRPIPALHDMESLFREHGFNNTRVHTGGGYPHTTFLLISDAEGYKKLKTKLEEICCFEEFKKNLQELFGISFGDLSLKIDDNTREVFVNFKNIGEGEQEKLRQYFKVDVDIGCNLDIFLDMSKQLKKIKQDVEMIKITLQELCSEGVRGSIEYSRAGLSGSVQMADGKIEIEPTYIGDRSEWRNPVSALYEELKNRCIWKLWAKRFPEFGNSLDGFLNTQAGIYLNDWLSENFNSKFVDFLVVPSDPEQKRLFYIKGLCLKYYLHLNDNNSYSTDAIRKREILKKIIKTKKLDEVKVIFDYKTNIEIFEKNRTPMEKYILKMILMALTFPLSVPIAMIYSGVKRGTPNFFKPDSQVLMDNIENQTIEHLRNKPK